MVQDIALIGFGEAGMTFASAARWEHRAVAFDVAAGRQEQMVQAGVVAAQNAQRALQDAPVVLSLVTADQVLAAAEQCAPHIAPGAMWCDMNSVAPETKRQAARLIEAAGGHYVDIAVLAPVNPAALGVSLLLSGEAAELAKTELQTLGFTNVRVVSADIGTASAIKMIRSVMVKGIEALTAEMMLAAAAAGVADQVLASLDASERAGPWKDRAAYNLERMTTHGLRRAAEMEESMKTLASLGVEPVMTAATVRRQREMGETGVTKIGEDCRA